MSAESGQPVAPESSQTRDLTYELFIGALSVLSIVNLVLYYLIRNPVVAQTMVIMDVVLSAIFLADFVHRLFKAESKSAYFFHRSGWADLLASFPFPVLKVLRIFRLVRVVRLERRYGVPTLIRQYVENRGESTLLTLLFLLLLVLEFGSMAMVWVESSSPEANIKTAGDSIWYSYVTIATVGYGDKYPVTRAGRIVGALIMTAGIALFGTLTAYLASAFLAPSKKAKAQEPPPGETEDLETRVQALKQLWLEQQTAMQAEIEELRSNSDVSRSGTRPPGQKQSPGRRAASGWLAARRGRSGYGTARRPPRQRKTGTRSGR
jgi:hypothetical protein